MTAQDLSHRELKVCAFLYTTKDSILFASQTLLSMEIDTADIFENFNSELKIVEGLSEGSFHGIWYGKPFRATPLRLLQSLIRKGLLIPQEEYKQKFYVLNIREEFKEFFDELKVQIALGSI